MLNATWSTVRILHPYPSRPSTKWNVLFSDTKPLTYVLATLKAWSDQFYIICELAIWLALPTFQQQLQEPVDYHQTLPSHVCAPEGCCSTMFFGIIMYKLTAIQINEVQVNAVFLWIEARASISFSKIYALASKWNRPQIGAGLY